MSVHEILSAITEAKVALDREPQLTSRILELERSLNQAQSHNQSLEVGIIGYKRTIDELETKVRSLEVERDDMGFRELEAEDKLNALRRVVSDFTSYAVPLMSTPIPVTQVEPVAEQVEVANPLPTASSLPDSSPPVQSTIADQNATGEALGERESPLPSSASMTEGQSQNATSALEATALSQPSSTPKPYEGKTYTQVFGSLSQGYISRDAWIEGGGTYQDWYV